MLFFFNDTATTEIYTLSLHDALPISQRVLSHVLWDRDAARDLCRDCALEHLGTADGVLIVDETGFLKKGEHSAGVRSEEHTSELQSRQYLVCRLLLEKKK